MNYLAATKVVLFTSLLLLSGCGDNDYTPATTDTNITKRGEFVYVAQNETPANILEQSEVEKLDTIYDYNKEQNNLSILRSAPDGNKLLITKFNNDLNQASVYNYSPANSSELLLDIEYTEFSKQTTQFIDNDTLVYIDFNASSDANEFTFYNVANNTEFTLWNPVAITSNTILCAHYATGRNLTIPVDMTLSYEDNGSRKTFYRHTDINSSDGSSGLETIITAVDYNSSYDYDVSISQNCSTFTLLRRKFTGALSGRPSVITESTKDALGEYTAEQNPTLDDMQLSVYDLSKSEITNSLITKESLPEVGAINNVRLSKDGSKITFKVSEASTIKGRENPVFKVSQKGYIYTIDKNLNEVAIIDLNNSALQQTNFTYHADGNLSITTIDEFSQNLYLYTFDDSTLHKISENSGSTTLASTGYADALFYTFGSITHAKQIYSYSIAAKKTTKVSNFFTDYATLQNTLRVDELSLDLGGGDIQKALLIQKATASFPPKSIPVVVWQAGGPGGEMINQYAVSPEWAYVFLAEFDIPTLILPLEMRPGWSLENWKALADNENFGSIDINRAKRFLETMASNGYADVSKLGVTGCSYGGYFAAQSAAILNGFYAAANPQCSLLDLEAEFETGTQSDFVSYFVGQVPWNNPDLYEKISPIYMANETKTPSLIFHGTEDFVQVSVAENLYSRINDTGTEVKMVEFEDEAHGLDMYKNQFYAMQEMIVWFRKYLDIDATE